MKKNRLLRAGIMTGVSLMFLTGVALASPTLQTGSHGHDVLLLQKKLKTIGYTIRTVDGVYGDETERAVAEFQRDQKIRVTGIVNNATWRALKKAKQREWGVDVPKPAAQTLPTNKIPLAPNNNPILAPGKVKDIIKTAKSYIGVPYKFGGTTPKAFDCSGYLQYVFAQNGIAIPRTADEQYKLGRRTTSSRQLVPGDLVFFTTYEPGASHCGIYLGNGDFIHASSSKGVRIDSLSSDYWQPRYYGGKHIVK
ncbi:Cell wall-associated hydrolase, NlpC family [Selenomonas sp. GACV-9]|uniref:C40 family peptidase n=1 Tax=Selenomonas sp. GACV-9 TaxID=3158782 RepID=UPI0008E4FF50|nr:Cell wall-associated hydrolase, NlpC family [Selenomonas ruminantium]